MNSAGGIMVQEGASGHVPTKEHTLPTSARERNLTADSSMVDIVEKSDVDEGSEDQEDGLMN